MYYELYIDVLFLVNFLMDYILLLITRRIMRLSASYGRVCLGALAGAFLTCLVVALHIPGIYVKLILFYTLIPAMMFWIMAGIRDLSKLVRGIITLMISGILVGGVFEHLSQYVEVGSIFFALAIASYYISCGILRVLALLFRFGEIRCRVTLYHSGRSCRAEAIIDTGNHLTDKASGKAVSVISRRLAARLFNGSLPEGMRYIPYHTIGRGGGVIPIIPIDSLCVDGDDQQWITHPVIAISEDTSFANDCDVILNPDI